MLLDFFRLAAYNQIRSNQGYFRVSGCTFWNNLNYYKKATRDKGYPLLPIGNSPLAICGGCLCKLTLPTAKAGGSVNLHGFILYLIVQMNMILLTSRKMRKELKRMRCLMKQLLCSKSCGDNTQAKRMVYILATRHTETWSDWTQSIQKREMEVITFLFFVFANFKL